MTAWMIPFGIGLVAFIANAALVGVSDDLPAVLFYGAAGAVAGASALAALDEMLVEAGWRG